MKRDERQSIVKLFVDLIKADRIIEIGEMSFFGQMKEKYGFTRSDEIAAASMTLADAIKTISDSDDEELKATVLADCRGMTESDGFRARSEALIMTALLHKLDSEKEGIDIISVPKSEFDITPVSVLYIESRPDKTVNEIIRQNYRMICKEFQVAGFHFIYIPAIIDHYSETDRKMLGQIISFLAPQNSEEGVNHIITNLLSMTTSSFCNDILCNKLSIGQLRDCSASMLIKLGNGIVGNSPYANYLKIEIGSDTINVIQEFLDEFIRLNKTDVITISTSEEGNSQFLYDGFYKELLDIFLIRKNIRSRIFIDLRKGQIYLPDIDRTVAGLHRREKALYSLLLHYGAAGINFTPPQQASAMARYEKRMARVQAQYRLLYRKFGGEESKAPDIRIPEIRRPMMSCIKRCFSALDDELYNPADYNVIKDANGSFVIHVEPEIVHLIKGGIDDTQILFSESELSSMLDRI